MIIGIRAHDVLKNNTTKKLIARLNRLKINNIQLVFKKSFKENNTFNKESAYIIGKELKDSKINVSMLGAYFNPVHSNKNLVSNNIEYFKEHLRYSSLLDCKYVGTETGSYNDDKWTYNIKNHQEEAYQEVKNVFTDLKETANETKTTILIEPAWNHVIYDIKTLKRLVEELNSDYVKVTIDIFNLLNIDNYKNYKEIFIEALSTFKDDIKVLHLKNFKVKNDKLVLCSLDKGLMDYNFIVANIKKYCPNANLIFEGVTGLDINRSRKYINKIISA